MDKIDIVRITIAAIFILIAIALFFKKAIYKDNPFTTKFITCTAIFAALSTILYIVPYLKFPVFFFPSFLELHFDEVPAFIAAFAYGPLSGFFVILIKTIVKLPMTTTLCVGEIADFLYSIVFVIPAALIYKNHRNFKGVAIGISVGFVCQIVFASIFTSFVMLNFYMFVMGLSEASILAMCQAVNPSVTSLGWTFCLLVALPFNALKDAIVIAVTLLLYKRLHRFIDNFGHKKTRKIS